MSEHDIGPEDVPTAQDLALLNELGQLLNRVDPPPSELVEMARQLWTWRTVDTELAALSRDSLIEDRALALRSAEGPRFVTFETPRLVIEVEVVEGSGGRRLIGQLDPPGRARLELRGPGPPITGTVDDLGRFAVQLPSERQRVSLRCVRPDGSAVETAWLVL